MKDIMLFTSANNETQIEVQFEKETVWLSQSQITQLFQRERSVITKHISNIFKEDELDKNSTVQKMHIANSDKPVDFYNLDVIISGDEAQGLLKVLSDYAFALDILDQYDHQSLKVRETDTKELLKISYQEAKKAIEGLKTKFGGSNLFGNEKDDSFKSSLATIY